MNKWIKCQDEQNEYDFSCYSVNEDGAIRNHISGRTLKHNISGRYHMVCLSDIWGTGKRMVYVHRQVALAFIPNPMNFPQVQHKDDNRDNNCADNLEWGTQDKNMQTCSKNNPASLISNRVLEDSEVREIKRLLTQTTMTHEQIAIQFGVSRPLITHIKSGKRWSHI